MYDYANASNKYIYFTLEQRSLHNDFDISRWGNEETWAEFIRKANVQSLFYKLKKDLNLLYIFTVELIQVLYDNGQ